MNIYLGADGAYHDDTEENRDRFPAAEDTPAGATLQPGDEAELTGDGTGEHLPPADAGDGTLTDTGEQSAEPTARTAKNSTK